MDHRSSRPIEILLFYVICISIPLDSCVAYLLTHSRIPYFVQGQDSRDLLLASPATLSIRISCHFSGYLRLTLFLFFCVLINMFSVDTNFREVPYVGACNV